MMKAVIGKLHENWWYVFPCEFGLVAPIHDEIVLDVPSSIAKEVARIVNDTMVKVAEEMCPGIKFNADVAIGSRWSEKR
jgi:DNA polymerase I-like protein with 3'-5' exonuclease and polymerase domains